MLSLPVLNLLISTAGDLFIADGSIISQNTSKYHYTRLSSTTLLAIFPLWFILFRLHHKNNKFLSCSHWLGDTGFCLSTQLILVILITATPSPAELSQCSWFQVQWEDNSYSFIIISSGCERHKVHRSRLRYTGYWHNRPEPGGSDDALSLSVPEAASVSSEEYDHIHRTPPSHRAETGEHWRRQIVTFTFILYPNWLYCVIYVLYMYYICIIYWRKRGVMSNAIVLYEILVHFLSHVNVNTY